MDQLICASLSHTHYWYEVGTWGFTGKDARGSGSIAEECPLYVKATVKCFGPFGINSDHHSLDAIIIPWPCFCVKFVARIGNVPNFWNVF